MPAETFSQFATVATQLLVIPLMLSTWGAEQYGYWLIIAAIPSYLALADLGISNIMANRTAMQVGQGDLIAARTTNQTSWLKTTWVVIFALLVTVLVGALLPVDFFAARIGTTAARWTLVLLGSSACISLAFGALGAAMRAVGWYGWLVFTNSIMRVTDSFALVLVAAHDGNFLHAAAFILAFRTAIAICATTRFFMLRPDFAAGMKLPDKRQERHTGQPSRVRRQSGGWTTNVANA